jgi:F-box/WD-40 domain protein 10
VHLSKLILSSLNKKSLHSSLVVSKYWYQLVREVHKASFLKKIRHDDIMLLKGISSKACNPRYASNTDVKVPNLYPGSHELMRKSDEAEVEIAFKTECNWANAYAGYHTRNIVMEERNVFCGPYNVLLLKEKRDPHRVIHLNGANLVAYGSFDKKIRFIDIKAASERNIAIQGHAGSIKCIYICEPKNLVVTGSFDTSIRYKI